MAKAYKIIRTDDVNVPIMRGMEDVKVYQLGDLGIILSKDNGLWHLSISHPSRYPTWNEIHDARYDLIPNDCYMAIILPPKEEYVNLHKNCFHLHELRKGELA